MVENKTEILVVGGGPAGVLSALTAAKFGRKVILIDAKSYSEIGNKTCGDAINLGPLNKLEKELGLKKPHGNEIADVVKEWVFQTDRIKFSLYGDGFVLNRHPYGQRLLKKAEEYGVEIRSETKAVKAIVDSSGVKGVTVLNKATKEKYDITSKITIDCSGRNFQIRKTIPRELFPNLEKKMEKRDVAASFRAIINLKEDHPYHNQISLIYTEEVPEPGYFWIFSKGSKKLNAGIGWWLDMKIEKGMKESFWEALHKFYPPNTYEVVEKGGYTIPTRYPLLNAVAPGFLTAGDAAFHVNPFTAEGHGPALIAGFYAGKTASDAILSDDVSIKKLWDYNIAIMRDFGLSHTKIQLFSEALYKAKISGLEFLFKREILSQDQFMDLHGGKRLTRLDTLKILIKAFPKYKLLLYINKISKGAQAFNELFERYPTSPTEYQNWLEEFNLVMGKIRER
ncbi:MAG: NAD(P)/FAD-dependent oxidoreductase [Candidatus Hodarchaeales archaeon]